MRLWATCPRPLSVRWEIKLDRKREIRRAVAAFVTFLAMLVLIVAVTLIVTGCAQNGQRTDELSVDENPPAPLQTRTYDMKLEELPWKATKVYDATSGRSWWLLRRVNTSSYVVLEVGGNVPVG